MTSEHADGKDWLYVGTGMPGKGRHWVGLGFPIGEIQVNSAVALYLLCPQMVGTGIQTLVRIRLFVMLA
jgi:hypothetical protein